MSAGWIVAEQLMAAVARAFYNDSVVVVLDALVREKYIIEEEIGPRLKLPNKEIRKVLNQLEAEGLIKFEHVNNIEDSKSSFKCYYVDYQSFVDIIRYRVFLLQQLLKKEESNELNEVYYQCPRCSAKYTSLQAQLLVSGDFKFVCSNCCPVDNIRLLTNTEEWYRLKEVDNRRQVNTIRSLHKKLDQQLSRADGAHDGIYDLLHQLREEPLPTNLPSENIKKGYQNTEINDDEVKSGIQYNLEHATAGKYGGSYIRKKNLETIQGIINKSGGNNMSYSSGNGLSQFLVHQPDIQINIVGEDGQSISTNQPLKPTNAAATAAAAAMQTRETALPEFLNNSRVKNADQVYTTVQSLQANRLATGDEQANKRRKGNEEGDDGDDDDDGHHDQDEGEERKKKQEEEGVAAGGGVSGEIEEDDLFDDIDWQDS